MMRDAVVSQRIERGLYVLIGDYLAASGWFALDADDNMSAQRYLDTALRAAGVAHDQSLQAYVWSVTEKRARHCGEFGEALAVAKTGLASTAARRNCWARAAFHALVAINLSKRGEKAQAHRSLGRAFDAFDSANTNEPPGRWFFANNGFMNAAGASVSLTLGRLSEAERYGQRALEDTPMSQTRNHAMRQLSLANIYVKMGELEHACAHATSVLALARRLHSRRLTHRLQRMHNVFTKWRSTPAVRDWNARYDQWAQQIKTGYSDNG
jgi:tetratricopeptide (TPR) repeat protein